jgi:hypothetical protein
MTNSQEKKIGGYLQILLGYGEISLQLQSMILASLEAITPQVLVLNSKSKHDLAEMSVQFEETWRNELESAQEMVDRLKEQLAKLRDGPT